MPEIPSQPPARNPAGWQSDPVWGPLGASGMTNPFLYHQFADDFDNSLQTATNYTLSGTGSAAHTAGQGGLALLSTLSTQPTFASLQVPVAGFVLPTTGATPPATSTSVKKVFWLARLKLSDVTLSAFIAGLCNVTATPFAGITDGIYFSKVAGGTVLNLIVATASTLTTLAIPTSAYTLTNATSIDLSWSLDRMNNVFAYVGATLVGVINSAAGSSVNSAGVSSITNFGPVAAIQQAVTSTPLSTANLTPTLAVSNGTTAAVKTMTVDFHCVQKER